MNTEHTRNASDASSTFLLRICIILSGISPPAARVEWLLRVSGGPRRSPLPQYSSPNPLVYPNTFVPPLLRNEHGSCVHRHEFHRKRDGSAARAHLRTLPRAIARVRTAYRGTRLRLIPPTPSIVHLHAGGSCAIPKPATRARRRRKSRNFEADSA